MDDWREHKLLVMSKLEQLDESLQSLHYLFQKRVEEEKANHDKIMNLDTKVKIFFSLALILLTPFLTFIANYILKHS